MFKTGHYDWSLFMWHLVIEKTLKAILSSKNKTVLPIHDLVRLAEKADLSLSDSYTDDLAEITTFNLEARYDDYKFKFYKKATKKFASTWAQKTEEIFKWLKQQL